jgi:L-2-hydroxycarboxylate dehydrogenase (NAD+)
MRPQRAAAGHDRHPPRGEMTRVSIDDLRTLMAQACRAADIPAAGVNTVVDHYLAGELRGKTSHGVAKFCFEARYFSHRQGSPRVVRQHAALAVVDARREVGPVSAMFAVDLAIRTARRHGAGVVGMINTQRYGILAPWSERIARSGLVGIVMNTSRAEAAPRGGRTPFLGVNPLSFAVPTLDEPLVVDMSTTEVPMGVLWECRRSGDRLPPGAFIDQDGQVTDDPHAATAAVVFGGHRGLAVSLLVQVMTGALFGFPMSHDVDSTWTTGYTFFALDPSFGGGHTDAAARTTRLVRAMASAATREGGTVRVPGQHSAAQEAHARRDGAVEIADALLQRLRARAGGDFTSN